MMTIADAIEQAQEKEPACAKRNGMERIGSVADVRDGMVGGRKAFLYTAHGNGMMRAIRYVRDDDGWVVTGQETPYNTASFCCCPDVPVYGIITEAD